MGERAGSLPLIGGALCLDFCNTTSGQGTDERLEHLEALDDVAAWAAHAGVLPAADARRAVQSTGKDASATALAEVLATRAAIHAVLDRVASQRPADPASVAALNARLSGAFAGATLKAQDGRFLLAYAAPGAALRPILNPILRSAADTLVCTEAGRLKRCPGHACGWLFRDETKNANRVWCEMRVCGSRAKARARRQRHGAADP